MDEQKELAKNKQRNLYDWILVSLREIGLSTCTNIVRDIVSCLRFT